jgi:crotonobetainyl-CoA:carnitine CoA-transferase CaiB-like acyl-CoA transferase
MEWGEGMVLAGLRVLDLADEKASFCSKLLSDLGAGVIKVEKRGGDASRREGPFWRGKSHPERSLSFWYNNTGKESVTLNLESEEGQTVFCKLSNRSDVIVETFPPGYLEGLGLGYESLTKTNPGLILASITGFGQDGPYREYKACDIVASAAGGQMYVNGAPDTPPLKPYGQQAYYTASLFAAIGILLALRERKNSGRGQHLDISLQEAVAASLEHVMVRYFYEGVVAKRQGSCHWNHSFCLLPCKDGYITLSPLLGWDTLVEWLYSEGMAADLTAEKWQDGEYRSQHVDHIIDVLKSWTVTHTTNELFELGQQMHFPWAPVASPKEILGSPQLQAREFFISVAHPEKGAQFICPGIPYRFSRSTLDIKRPAPLIGEHNIQVYHRELGFDQDKLDELSSRNII